jgi:hypothetical protein
MRLRSGPSSRKCLRLLLLLCQKTLFSCSLRLLIILRPILTTMLHLVKWLDLWKCWAKTLSFATPSACRTLPYVPKWTQTLVNLAMILTTLLRLKLKLKPGVRLSSLLCSRESYYQLSKAHVEMAVRSFSCHISRESWKRRSKS